jgi:phosphoglycolate phosphatase-like HAD superfamily hydrolase
MKKRLYFVLTLLLCSASFAQTPPDPLPSWNDGPAKQAILDFVRVTTDPESPQFVPPPERIATFDNDGTLWVEQPLYTQFAFALDRIAALAPKHPEWKEKQPFKAILTKDKQAIETFTLQDIEKILAQTHSGITIDAFQKIVKDWLTAAKHPKFDRPYTELIYQPMLELLCYLRVNGYRTYIVTGGGQEFVRSFAERIYGVPPEQVIGSAGKVKYEYGPNGKPMLLKLPEVLLIDDKAGKPESINLFIGRRPQAAFGNSTGDRQMLEWTQAGEGARLAMLVHHDDATREYDYGPKSKIGAFPDSLTAEAKKRGWVIISMKNDWKQIFAGK